MLFGAIDFPCNFASSEQKDFFPLNSMKYDLNINLFSSWEPYSKVALINALPIVLNMQVANTSLCEKNHSGIFDYCTCY